MVVETRLLLTVECWGGAGMTKPAAVVQSSAAGPQQLPGMDYVTSAPHSSTWGSNPPFQCRRPSTLTPSRLSTFIPPKVWVPSPPDNMTWPWRAFHNLQGPDLKAGLCPMSGLDWQLRPHLSERSCGAAGFTFSQNGRH